VNALPVPVAAEDIPGWKTRALEVAAVGVVTSTVCAPAKVTTPAVVTLKLEEIKARVPPEFPIAVLPVDEPRVVAPDEDRVVKAPVEVVVAPMAVELIPVEVVVK
jgi:hypothetical protein